MNPQTNKIILFEYDIQLELYAFVNYEAGIWEWTITPAVTTFEDDNGNTGYYDWDNRTIYNVQSFRYGDLYFAKVSSLSELRVTANSFFYDGDTTKLYIRRTDFDPPLTDNLLVGVAVGYSYKSNTQNYYFSQYYEPRVDTIFSIKKSIDPLFYGLIKFQSGNVKFINNDGHFDNWRDRKLYAIPARILVGNFGDEYDGLGKVYSGYIENDKRTWSDFSLTIQDTRKAFTQGIATNLLNTTDYPDMNTDNVDLSKPVAYGSVSNAKAYCLNEEAGGATYTFNFWDTEFRQPVFLIFVRVDGVLVTPASVDITTGTFVLNSSDVGDNFDDVTCTFGDYTTNGVAIIKDILNRYADIPFLDTFFDIDEMNLAESLCRDTSLYCDSSDFSVTDGIESLSNDCDIRFFMKDSGVFTARIYDDNRTPDYTIYKDDWMDEPQIVNNSNQFLTSCRVGYMHDIEEDKRLYYENTDFKDSTFDIYKQYKTESFDTELTTLADAIDKSNTIMNISKNIQDIVSRTTHWGFSGIEPTDFVVCNPTDRLSNTIDNFGIYEVLGIDKNIAKMTVKLKLRFVKEYTP